jgi:hypothetical protein
VLIPVDFETIPNAIIKNNARQKDGIPPWTIITRKIRMTIPISTIVFMAEYKPVM